MDELDRLFQRHLGPSGAARGPLTDEDVRLFVENKLEGARLESVLERLAQNPDDREWVLAVRRRLAESAQIQSERVGEGLVRAASGNPISRLGSASCPHCGKAITPFKKSPDRQKLLLGLWAAIGLSAFVLSFMFPRYFLQCLTVTVLAGCKWIVDQRALKAQILVYRALSGAPEHGHLHKDDARL